jgi:hypothetical protein
MPQATPGSGTQTGPDSGTQTASTGAAPLQWAGPPDEGWLRPLKLINFPRGPVPGHTTKPINFPARRCPPTGSPR